VLLWVALAVPVPVPVLCACACASVRVGLFSADILEHLPVVLLAVPTALHCSFALCTLFAGCGATLGSSLVAFGTSEV
jgi:hypothetical protein